MTKTCSRCKQVKAISHFCRDRSSRDGYGYTCRECNAAYHQIYKTTAAYRISKKKSERKLVQKGYHRFGKGAIHVLRQSARNRGFDCAITAEELRNWWESTPDTCYYCGTLIDDYLSLCNSLRNYPGNNPEVLKFRNLLRGPSGRSRWMTIDRKDSSIGYSVTNLVKACWFCNSAKGGFIKSEQMRSIAPDMINDLKMELQKGTPVS